MALGFFVGWYFGIAGFGRVVRLLVGPLWFLGVYLMLIALLPATRWLHRRYGVLARADYSDRYGRFRLDHAHHRLRVV